MFMQLTLPGAAAGYCQKSVPAEQRGPDADPAEAVEYYLEFASKAEAEDALDCWENQPGYLGCVAVAQGGGWGLKVRFAAAAHARKTPFLQGLARQ
jgi:hypothetical protein